MTEIDFRILDFIREKLSNSFLDFAMPKLTAVGNIGLIWIFIAAAVGSKLTTLKPEQLSSAV